MKKILFALSFIFILVGSCYVRGDNGENEWNVTWYTIDRITEDFNSSICSETWPAGNFSYDWRAGVVYDDMSNYVGFIATTHIYSKGGKYKFRAYGDDYISVSIDGDEILKTTKIEGAKEVEVEIPKGTHILEVRYKETCCRAKVWFSTDKELFEKNSSVSQLHLIIGIVLVVASIITATFLLKKFGLKNENK